MLESNPFISNQNAELLADIKDVILFNDDFNTFDFVIESLVEVCGHNPEQAEQCALIVHFNGKCAIKSGSYSDMKPIYRELLNRQLTVEIS
ncbi:MAG: ATP-dependent Clp protease adaptor ClpS [Saprospiraceae bacterium]|nr:ATP-dependent Clp protease adaptor ClpS [Saprospiraceae bacterium]